MKNSLAIVNKRRQDITSLLENHSRLSIDELASAFNVSSMTIRRDLNELENQGIVHHKHGYAEFVADIPIEGDTQNPCIEEIKKCIAKQASKYIKTNETIFLNSSSTAIGILDYITSERNTIITNNIEATRRQMPEDSSLILTGGEVRFPKEALIGQVAIAYLKTLYSDITFIGCSGISKHGVTTNNLYEAQINRIMIQHTHARNLAVVADYRKIGFNSNFTSGSLNDVRYLITDSHADPHTLKAIEKAGVNIIQIKTTSQRRGFLLGYKPMLPTSVSRRWLSFYSSLMLLSLLLPL